MYVNVTHLDLTEPYLTEPNQTIMYPNLGNLDLTLPHGLESGPKPVLAIRWGLVLLKNKAVIVDTA